MIFAKRRSGMQGGEIENADGSFYSDQRQAEYVVCAACVWIGVYLDGGALPEGAVNEVSLNFDGRRCVGMTVPATDFEGLFFEVSEQNDCTFVGWDHLEDKLQKFALQQLRVADGINDAADSEERGQVSRHASDFDPEGWEARRWGGRRGI